MTAKNPDGSPIPVYIDDSLSAEDLVDAMEARLQGSLEDHLCSATPDGWRKLALALILKQYISDAPTNHVRTPYNSGSTVGRKKKQINAFRLDKMDEYIRSGRADDVADAARKVSKFDGRISARALENLYCREKGSAFRLWLKKDFDDLIGEALTIAADRLEVKEQRRSEAFRQRFEGIRRERGPFPGPKKVKGSQSSNGE